MTDQRRKNEATRPAQKADIDSVIRETIAQWQKHLLQLDRRNNLLYFKGKSSVRLLVDDVDQFLVSLSESRAGLPFLYAEKRTRPQPDNTDTEPDVYTIPGEIEADCPPLELQKRLRKLWQKDREWEEEQGLNVLFLAVGFLEWIDEDSEVARSPILLVPCGLARASPRDPFVLRREEDDSSINLTLTHQLAKFGVVMPDVSPDQSPSGYIDTVRKIIRSKPGWRVDADVHLATFQYSKMAMWEDLEELRKGGVEHRLVRGLCGERSPDSDDEPSLSAKPKDKPDHELVAGALDDDTRLDSPLLALQADFTQLRAIQAVRSGQHLLIHGPPGTGKSQTIANTIGALLADGKRVLFVSEKTAALDVVKRRLDQAGLGVFCLDLHSERGRKNNVYAQLRLSLDSPRHVPADRFDHKRLNERRTQLNEYVRALHERRDPLGRSVFQVQGRLANLRAFPDVRFSVRSIGSFDQTALDEYVWLAARIAQRPLEFREHFTSLWIPLRATTTGPDLPDVVRAATRLLRSSIDDLRMMASRVCAWLGIQSPDTVSGVAHLQSLLLHFEDAPVVPSHWLDAQQIVRLRACVAEEAARQAERSAAMQQTRPSFGDILPDLPFEAFLTSLPAPAEIAARAKPILGPTWSQRISVSPRATAEALDSFVVATANLSEAVSEIARQLNVQTASSARTRHKDGDWLRSTLLSDYRRVPAAMTELASLQVIPDSWIEMTDDALDAEIEKIEDLTDQIRDAESRLFSSYTEGFLDIVSEEMLVRYKTDHRSLLSIVKSECRRDRRLLRGSRRDSKKVAVDVATTGIELALKVRSLRKQLDDLAPITFKNLGDRFRGTATNWPSVHESVACLRRCRDVIPVTPPVRELLLSGKGRDLFLTSAQELAALLQTYESCAGDLWSGLADSGETVTALAGLAESLSLDVRACVTAVEDCGKHCHSPLTSLTSIRRVVESAVTIRKAIDDLDAKEHQLVADFDHRYKGFETDWDEITHCLLWTDRVIELTDRVGSLGRWKEHAVEPASKEGYAQSREELGILADKFALATTVIGEIFELGKTPLDDCDTANWPEVDSWCERLAADADHAPDWLQYQRLVQEADKLSSTLVDQLRHATEDALIVPDIVERRLLMCWLEWLVRAVPVLKNFGRVDHEAAIAEFRDLDRRSTLVAAREIRRRLLKEYPETNVTLAGAGQLGTLRDQLSRRRGQMPVRRLLARIPHLVQVLKPCFMVSPLAVSQFLPRTNDVSESLTFDTVVFDEASQVFPEDAVPAIVRGRQLIVVGDEQQLPPTSFFRRAFDDDDDYSEEDSDDAPVDALAGRDSILDVMSGMLGQNVAERYLRVHYRSRHENLIRFSNHSFYRDQLIVFPSPDPTGVGHGLNNVYLADGRYDAGASRTNQREAEKVVEIIFDLMRSKPLDESIGVVALSRAQADLIEFLIEQRRILEPDVEFRFIDPQTEPFFVKNLENVQGDERDHIVLSIGYGPTTATGLVPNRFGPINAAGGHRRLNVVVTRARRSLTVVHSLLPTHIHSDQQGPRLLRRYLEYLEDPISSFEAQVTGVEANPEDSEFEQAVCEALTARGHKVSRQVGVAGYSIDLAVQSEDSFRFDLGIECDGFAYHSSPAARDRDWLRQSILEQLGWSIHRIWSTAWLRNQEQEIVLVEEALAKSRNKSRTVRNAPRTPAAPNQTPIQSPVNDLTLDLSPPGGADDSGRTSAEQTGRSELFDVYRTSSLTGLRRGPDLQYETYPVLIRMIDRVTDAEGPVHFETILERIREYYGMTRARQASRDQVWRAVSRGVREGELKIVEGSDADDAFLSKQAKLKVIPRRPATDDNRRPILRVSLLELKAGILVVAKALYGASAPELIREVARQFGYDRTGSEITESLETAIDELVADGVLVRSFDMLSVQE